jgi:hypothetical protein
MSAFHQHAGYVAMQKIQPARHLSSRPNTMARNGGLQIAHIAIHSSIYAFARLDFAVQ